MYRSENGFNRQMSTRPSTAESTDLALHSNDFDSDAVEGLCRVLVLILIPAVLTKETLLIQLKVLLATSLCRLLCRCKVHGESTRWALAAEACAKDLGLHLLRENLACLRRVALCVVAIVASFDATSLLLVGRLSKGAAKAVL